MTDEVAALLRVLRSWPGARALPVRPREHAVRDQLMIWLIDQGVPVIRERPTNGGRVDLFLPLAIGPIGIAVELKVKKVSFGPMLRQIKRYSAADEVAAIVVLTWNSPQLAHALAACGKPVFCHDYAGALFR